MVVLLDAHILGQRETGNETYLRELICQAPALAQHGIRLIPAVTPGHEAGLTDAVVNGRLANDVARLTRLLPRLARETAADLVHVTYHGPLFMRTPMVVTIHDVSYRLRPRLHSLRNVLLQNAIGYLTARRARLVLTVSSFCRGEIERIYPFARGRIAVTYETSNLGPPPRDWLRRLHALGIGQARYVFSIGRFQPRKNLARLARAFLSARFSEPLPKLVLAGDHATSTGRLFRREFADAIDAGRIVLPGYLDGADVSLLYAGCACFAFPSLYEGFGLPVLEAMRAGAPVITSTVTALPEVAGDAALLVNPEDETALARALARALDEPGLAGELSARGRRRAAEFSGERFVEATSAAYARALDWGGAHRS